MLSRFLVLGIFCSLALLGCGGGDSDPSPTTRIQVTVDWAARSRRVGVSSSALSAVLILRGASLSGSDISFVANRDPARLEAHSQVYTSAAEAKRGTYFLEARFHALADGGGQVVGTAQAQVRVAEGGVVRETLAVNQRITSVELTPGQSVKAGETRALNVAPRDASGNFVAVTPGSVFFEVTGGGDRLRVAENGGLVTGVAPGQATVRAIVDGVASAEVIVTVLEVGDVPIIVE